MKPLLTLLLALPLHAQPKVACDTLTNFAIPSSAIGLPTSGATITAAVAVPAAPQTVNETRAVLATPDYCKVTGHISPVDKTAPNINFQVNLPNTWNRKIAQMGGSGNNGVIPVALTNGMHWGPESIPPNAPFALSRGFVTYGSDSGHQAGGRGAPPPPIDWTTNDEAVANFAFGQMKKTHDVTVALVAKFYAQPILHSYYLGSSQGGREALIVAQRFPQDYDGVFAQVPANTYFQLSIGDPLARAKTQTGAGWIPPAKVAVIAKEVMRQCDALDGIEDGLVSNYRACYKKFDPPAGVKAFAAIRCADGADTGDTCLSDPQILAASAVYAGSASLPGWSTGSESATNWKTFPARQTAENANFGMLRTRIVRDPKANLLEINLADYSRQIQEFSAEFDATNPDLSAFQRRGGKLILKVNTTDYTVNPRWVMDYYEKVVKTMGNAKANEFLRFYIAIGLFHNRNVGKNPLTDAAVPGYVDFISMLDEWVEKGKAPADTQILSDMDTTPPFAIHSTFPMCRYPAYPHYNGKGDAKNAGSYTCKLQN